MVSKIQHSWDDVKVFVAVARHNNIHKAAEELKLNYTTVLRKIKALEACWNVLLIEKTLSGYQITQQAKEYIGPAEALETNHQQLFNLATNQNDRLTGNVSITTTNTLYQAFIADELEKFKKAYPQITISVDLSLENKDLANNQADLAIRMTHLPPDHLAGKKLTDVEFDVFSKKSIQVCKDQKLVNQGEGNPETGNSKSDNSKSDNPNTNSSPAKIPLIVWSKDPDPSFWASQLYQNFEVTMTFNDFNSILDAVKKGLGTALLPTLLVEKTTSGQLLKQQLTNPVPASQLWVLFRPEHREIKRIKCLKDFLVNSLSR